MVHAEHEGEPNLTIMEILALCGHLRGLTTDPMTLELIRLIGSLAMQIIELEGEIDELES